MVQLIVRELIQLGERQNYIKLTLTKVLNQPNQPKKFYKYGPWEPKM